MSASVSHQINASPGKVEIYNDEDDFYVETMESREQVQAFIERLRRAADEAFGPLYRFTAEPNTFHYVPRPAVEPQPRDVSFDG